VPAGPNPAYGVEHPFGTVNDPISSLFVNGAVTLRIIWLLLSRAFGGGE
jgi:hypothetical protein